MSYSSDTTSSTISGTVTVVQPVGSSLHTVVDQTPSPLGNGAVISGTVTIITAGTAVQLPNISCKRVRITAHEGNGGVVLVGDSSVVAALVGRTGIPYFPTQGDWHNVSNLNLLFIDSTASGDKITYYAEQL